CSSDLTQAAHRCAHAGARHCPDAGPRPGHGGSMTAPATLHRVMGGAATYRGPIALALVIMLAGDLLLRLGGDNFTAFGSLLDVVLIVTPLAGLVLGTTRVHHARDVIELLLAQPVSRRRVFFSLWLRDTVPLALALAVGVIAPFAWHRALSGLT